MSTVQSLDRHFVTSDELAEMMQTEKVVPIDVRDTEEYEAGHIPGAVNIPDVFYYLVDTSPEGLKEFQDHFARLFGEAGLTGEETAVFYEKGFSLKSPRGYWILEYLGYPRMAVLQGSLREWKKGDHPVVEEKPALPAGSAEDFPVEVNPSIMATADQMQASLDDPNVVKLDVRDEEEWMGDSSSPYGIDFVPRKGRLPNSVWIDWNILLSLGEDSKGCFKVMEDKGDLKDLSEIEQTLADKGITKAKQINLYCFKGARTSAVHMALEMLGYPDVRTYFGSWNEWAKDDSRPIETGAPQK